MLKAFEGMTSIRFVHYLLINLVWWERFVLWKFKKTKWQNNLFFFEVNIFLNKFIFKRHKTPFSERDILNKFSYLHIVICLIYEPIESTHENPLLQCRYSNVFYLSLCQTVVIRSAKEVWNTFLLLVRVLYDLFPSTICR